MLKDSKDGNFVESILDDLQESTLTGFFTDSIGMFNVPDNIFITTDGYHYESSLIETGRILGKRIRRQRCLFHIEKDLTHNIKDSHKEEELEPAKRLVKYMFFQNETNLNKLGKNKEAVLKLSEGESEDIFHCHVLQPCNDKIS